MESTNPAASRKPRRLDDFPSELLGEIIQYCDCAPPSESRLNHEPGPDMFAMPERTRTLKNMSLVSKKCRALALPLLFKHVIWSILPSDQVEPIFKFLVDNNLGPHVETFIMVVPPTIPDMFLTKDAHVLAPSFSWGLFFTLLDPLRMTMLGTPQVLTSVVSKAVFNGDDYYDSGKTIYHILSLDRNERPRPTAIATAIIFPPPPPTNKESAPHQIFTIRPWTHLLLNEGSSVHMYSHPEHAYHRPPSVTKLLFGRVEAPHYVKVTLVPDTLKSVSYVAASPVERQIDRLLEDLPRAAKGPAHVKRLPLVDKLFLHLHDPPGGGGGGGGLLPTEMMDPAMILSAMRKQRELCYLAVARHLYQVVRFHSVGKWVFVIEFEAEDADAAAAVCRIFWQHADPDDLDHPTTYPQGVQPVLAIQRPDGTGTGTGTGMVPYHGTNRDAITAPDLPDGQAWTFNVDKSFPLRMVLDYTSLEWDGIAPW